MFLNTSLVIFTETVCMKTESVQKVLISTHLNPVGHRQDLKKASLLNAHFMRGSPRNHAGGSLYNTIAK